MTAWPLLLEPEQLAASLDDSRLLILDTSSSENYARHHVPGALHVAPAALQCGLKPAVGKLPSIKALEMLFSQVGLSPDRHVVVYDDEGGGWAGRLIWTLDVLGHRHYSYLNGGLTAWLNEGHPVDRQVRNASPTQFTASVDREPIADIEHIQTRLGSDDFAIWDARSPEEYRGEKVAARRGGHIPGAVNLDWMQLKDPQRNLRLVDLDALQKRLEELGLTRDKEIVTHCQTHHRSGLSYLAMKALGYPHIRGYDGSWAEWGHRNDTPVESDDPSDSTDIEETRR